MAHLCAGEECIVYSIFIFYNFFNTMFGIKNNTIGDLNEQIVDLKRQVVEMEDRAKNHQAIIDGLREEARLWGREMEKTELHHQEEIDDLEAEYEAAAKKVKSQHEVGHQVAQKEIETTKAQHTQEIETTKAQHTQEIETTKEDTEAAVAYAETKGFNDGRKTVLDEMQGNIDEVVRIRIRLNAEEDKLRRDAACAVEALHVQSALNATLTTDIAHLKERNDTLVQNAEARNDQIVDHLKDIAVMSQENNSMAPTIVFPDPKNVTSDNQKQNTQQ